MSDNQHIEKGARLKKIREILCGTEKTLVKFAEDMGMLYPNYSRIESGYRDIPTSLLEKLANVSNGNMKVNINYLLIGEGEPLIGNNLIMSDTNKTNVSFYDIEAVAGLGIQVSQIENITDKWYIPNLVGDHIAVNVKGNSMQPTLFEGDKVVAKLITDPDHIDHNTLHIVVYDGAPIIKRVFVDRDQILLKSDNPFYKTIIADITLITSLFKIVMYIRYQ